MVSAGMQMAGLWGSPSFVNSFSCLSLTEDSPGPALYTAAKMCTNDGCSQCWDGSVGSFKLLFTQIFFDCHGVDTSSSRSCGDIGQRGPYRRPEHDEYH